MSKRLNSTGLVWPAILDRFEQHAPAGVMARMALEHALPAGWVDEVFEAHRQRQYSRELLFSTVVELITLVSLGEGIAVVPASVLDRICMPGVVYREISGKPTQTGIAVAPRSTPV